MMLHKATLLSVFLLFGCVRTEQFYQGYVYDGQTKQPMANIRVRENYPNNKEFTYTDAKGYFKLKKDPSFLADLIFSAKNRHPDTIATSWSQSGEKMRFKFLNSRPDTVFLSLNLKH
jgi:hypothetical protein